MRFQTAVRRPTTVIFGLGVVLASCAPAASPGAPASSAPAATGTVAQASATPKPLAMYAKVANIDLPKAAASFDFAAIDSQNKVLYVTDRTNGGLSVITLGDEKYVTTITGFVGIGAKSDVSGPNGIEIIPDLKQLWSTDGDSTVKVVDLTTRAVIASISTGGKKRGDDLAYDPKDKIMLVANDSEAVPFLTFVSVSDRTTLGKLDVPGDGLEGIQWNTAKNVFYVSVPGTKANPGGEIDLVDPKAMKITQVLPLTDCNPHGIAFGPNQAQLLVACSKLESTRSPTIIIDTNTGAVVSSIPEVGGGDIAIFDAGTGYYFIGESNMTSDGTKTGSPAPQFGIIDSKTGRFVQGLPGAKSAHTVVVDPATGRLYAPVPTKGISVFAIAK